MRSSRRGAVGGGGGVAYEDRAQPPPRATTAGKALCYDMPKPPAQSAPRACCGMSLWVAPAVTCGAPPGPPDGNSRCESTQYTAPHNRFTGASARAVAVPGMPHESAEAARTVTQRCTAIRRWRWKGSARTHTPPPPCVTFRRVVVSLRGPGQPPVLPFACCVGSLRCDGRCGRCFCWCRFRVRGAQ